MLGLVASVAAPRAHAAPALETVADIWAVGRWDLLQSHPLAITGTVTLVDPERRRLVLQHGRDVIALDLGRARLEVRPGQRVLLKATDSWPTLPGTPRFPLDPDFSEQLRSFESRPVAQPGFYLARFRGWVHPPASGEYHFLIASDDASELLLGADASPQSRRVIARVTSYTDERDWHRTASQRSEAVFLEAGRAYYIEALHQQAGGRNHLSVAWEGPGNPLRVVSGEYLTPWNAESGSSVHDGAAAMAGATRGRILREVWEDVTIDYPVDLILPRKLATSLVVRDPTVELLELARWPEPQAAQMGQRVEPSDNFRWTQVEGTLTYLAREGNRVVLELTDGARRIEVVMAEAQKELPGHLRGRRVRVQGAGEALWDGDQRVLGRIWAPAEDALTLLQEPPKVEFSRVTSIHELTQGANQWPEGAAVKVVGRVVHQDGNRVTLSDNGTFRAFISSDGVNWDPLGPTIDVEMPPTVLVGFAVNSRSPENFSDAVFSDVAGLPAELRLTDVGAPRRAGRLTARDGRYVISGVGSDIWNTPDQFTFVHAPLDGDGVVVARLASLRLADPAARAGIMFRSALDPDAQFVQLVQSAETGQLLASVQWRGQAIGQSQHAVHASAPSATPEWLRLERRTSRVVVRADPRAKLAPGETVEVAGYVALESNRPVIADAVIQPVRTQRDELPLAGRWRPEVEIAAVLDDARKWGGFDFFRIRGVVTFSGEVAGRRYWTMQDASGAVVLQARDPSKLFHVPAGTLVDVYSNPGWFPPTNTLFADNVFRLGEAAMPKPIRHPAEYLLPKRGEGTWTELEGVVRAVPGEGLLEVKTSGEIFSVAIPRVPRTQLEAYVDGTVRIRGAIVFPSERERMLLVPSLEQVELLQAPQSGVFEQPVESMRALATDALLNEARRRTRVSGVITLASPTVIFVQDESGGVQVELTAPNSLPLGAAVDVVGFPDAGGEGGVVLRHALIRDLGRRAVVDARNRDAATLGGTAGGMGQLVRIRAEVTQRTGDWLELTAGGRIWRAARPANGEALPALPPGSVVELAGIFVPSTAQYPWVRPAERAALQPASQLLLRSPADVTVLATPTWWAVRRTLIWAGLLGLVLAAGFVWIQVLRRRVRQRSAELAATMQKLEDEVRMSATLVERERLAGEIHDSVEQGLNGLVMQLETTADLKACPPEVRSQLLLARNMAAFGRTEVKHAIWELQSPLLEDADLPEAVQKVVAQTVPESLRTTVTVKGQSRRLSSAVEHHLLRLVQEAVNNAVKHAQAHSLVVEICFGTGEVEITVTDDGCGFDATNRSLARLGHFGLSSMRNRANKISGELDITSSPGQGTKMRIRVPDVPTP